MRFQTAINGQPYTLDYAINGGNQVWLVFIYGTDGTDHTNSCDYGLLNEAWGLAQQHHTRAQAMGATQPAPVAA